MMIATCEELKISPSKTLFPLSIVSIATISALPLGSGATQAAELNGYLEANGYTDFVVALTDPMKARLPMLIAMMIYCIFFATKFSPDAPVVQTTEMKTRQDNKEALAPFQERAGYIIFILTTIALIFQRQLGIETWVICLTGAVLMVLCGVLTEKEAIASINWPIAILACKAMGANPIGIIILVQSACLSSFMTPMATPAVPMCMASGGYNIPSLIKQSILPACILLYCLRGLDHDCIPAVLSAFCRPARGRGGTAIP
jgi:di/tricarboxylate transporter